jgi:hypothetical protein
VPLSATGARPPNPVASRSGAFTTKRKLILNAMTTKSEKPKAALPDFADAHKACRTSAEREQLALVLNAGWTSAELQEYARLYFFRNGRDYPTPTSYRRAIADIVGCSKWRHSNEQASYDHPFSWLKLFRKGKSKPMPPRREGLLQRGRGLSLFRVCSEEYSWPGHTEEIRSKGSFGLRVFSM